MINAERQVPITEVSLLDMYFNVFAVAMEDSAPAKLEATNPGEFEVTANNKFYLANEPVKTLNFKSGVTAGTVLFVPAYDYEGFAVNGTAVETAGDEVKTSGYGFYSAVLSSGTVTITAIND
jgi:hypothetical protein